MTKQHQVREPRMHRVAPSRRKSIRAARLLLTAVAISTIALVSSPQPSLAQEVKLRLQHFMPEASIQHTDFFLPWTRRIEAASEGRIKINVTAAMGLGGKPSELIDQVQSSTVDIVWAAAGYTPGRFPKLGVFELPWVTSSRAAPTSMALHEYYETHARDELADVHVLAVWCHPSGVIMSKNREVLTPTDLKGLKIRAPSAQTMLMLSSFGAEPKPMPAPIVAAELDQDRLDGTLFPYEVIPTFKLQDRIHHITEFAGDRGLFTSVFILAMSKSAYAAMSPELRQVIDNHSGMKLATELGRLFDSFEEVGRDAFRASGGSVSFIRGAQYDAWYQQTQPSVDAWISRQKERGVDGEVLLKSAKDLIVKYTRLWQPY